MTQILPLPAELQKVAINELGEVPARISADLQAIKLWIRQQPHLKANTDDQFLIHFLRYSKYSLERAKEKIDYFFAIKTKYPEFFLFTDVDEPRFRKLHDTGSYYALPRPLNDCGPRIVLLQFRYSAQEFTCIDVLKHCAALTELVMVHDPYGSINGLVVVADYAHCTTSHIRQVTPILIKTVLTYLMKAFPLRFKAIYTINLPTYAEQVVKLALSFAPQKLKDRIFFCGKGYDILSEHIPKRYLPQDYGGENGLLNELCAEYHNVWDKHLQYLKQNANYGTVERLRIGKPMTCDGDLQTEGSFRRLEID